MSRARSLGLAKVWLCGPWSSLRTESRGTRYLGTGEDDRFLQVFQHERKHRGGEGHGVRAVDDHKALVLGVVSLLGRMSSGRTRSPHHRPSPGNMAVGRYLLTGHEKEERPGMLAEGLVWYYFISPVGPLWKARLCLESPVACFQERGHVGPRDSAHCQEQLSRLPAGASQEQTGMLDTSTHHFLVAC